MFCLRTLILLLLPIYAQAGENLIFKNAYVAAAPPGARAMAAYMEIENAGRSQRRIAGITSTEFSETQIHRSIIENGIAKMQPIENLVIDPGSTTALEPGGLHLMLIEPQRELMEGETVFLEIREMDGTLHSLGLKIRPVETHKNHHH